MKDMTVKITPAPLSGGIKAIPSKSQAHRAFICAALSNKKSKIICESVSDDIKATINCLTALGAEIAESGGTYAITPINKENSGKTALNCGESGSTLRFLLPVVSALGRTAVIDGCGRLPERPIQPLTEQLNANGAVISESFPIKCGGKLKNGVFRTAGNISSQFISGLLLASPLTGGDCRIEVTTELESKPYIDMTISVMKQYGIEVAETDNGYLIKGGQQYASPDRFTVEGDWSNAAFWLVAGALGGRSITCTNLNPDSLQGDKAVIRILKQFGAKVESQNNAYTVFPAPLSGIEIDAADIPDLVPVLAVAACGAVGRTRIYNASRLRFKESDRLAKVYEILTNLGADIAQTDDGLIINGTGRLSGGRASASGDHRLAMSLAVASVICEKDVIIDGAESVNKSYPAFFEDFVKLNGHIERC